MSYILNVKFSFVYALLGFQILNRNYYFIY